LQFGAWLTLLGKKATSQDVVLMIQRRWRGVLTRRRLLGTVWAGG